jgi:hypothetical protein
VSPRELCRDNFGRVVLVEEGQIGIEGVDVMNAGADFLLLDVDCAAKYAEIGPRTSHGLTLFAGERTLHVPETSASSEPTVIRIDGLEGDWSLVANIGRYTCVIALIRRRPLAKET